MAKVVKNLLVQGLSGKLGDQIILKSGKNGQTIVCAKSNFEKRCDSPAQRAHQRRFREAAAYARAAKTEAVYIEKARGKPKSPYNVALADCFKKPEILQVELTRWTGAPGEVIRIQAMDDIQVVQVRVEIRDETGAVLEAGQASAAGALWWEYTTQTGITGTATVTTTAVDLPGNRTEESREKVING